jgi:ubiquinone/menaquinone biosynthesis C-methylase UbiE
VQNDQLDIAHHMFLILLNQKLHLAPIKEPKRILDLGCGTGIWCMDMAGGKALAPFPSISDNLTKHLFGAT